MRPFPLKIVTPDGLSFDGQAESVTLRTAVGEVGILAGHMDFVTTLGMGRCKIVTEGKERIAACIGGMVSVSKGSVNVVATTFEWAEDIDKARAEKAAEEAKEIIQNKTGYTKHEIDMAEAKLKRALVRIGCAK